MDVIRSKFVVLYNPRFFFLVICWYGEIRGVGERVQKQANRCGYSCKIMLLSLCLPVFASLSVCVCVYVSFSVSISVCFCQCVFWLCLSVSACLYDCLCVYLCLCLCVFWLFLCLYVRPDVDDAGLFYLAAPTPPPPRLLLQSVKASVSYPLHLKASVWCLDWSYSLASSFSPVQSNI